MLFSTYAAFDTPCVLTYRLCRQTRNYVQAVALIVIDEIHLLGEDRGPVLEVIVSRTNFIASHTTRKLRVVGLSTALANAKDLADWLGIGMQGLFNFRYERLSVQSCVYCFKCLIL